MFNTKNTLKTKLSNYLWILYNTKTNVGTDPTTSSKRKTEKQVNLSFRMQVGSLLTPNAQMDQYGAILY